MTDTTLINRAIIRISGEDVRGFLQGLVTQNLETVQPDAPQWSALLTAQGKVLFDFFLWAEGDNILVDCETAAADDLVKRLTIYRLRRKITIVREEDLAVHWALQAPGQPTDPRLHALGHRWLAQANGATDGAYRAHRLSLGVTEGRDELGSDRTLWLECNAEELNGVDFKKGCYVGQENTARMHYRNKVNRRLVVVPLDQADEKRQRLALPDLGLSIEHRRVEDIDGAFIPDWLAAALTPSEGS